MTLKGEFLSCIANSVTQLRKSMRRTWRKRMLSYIFFPLESAKSNIWSRLKRTLPKFGVVLMDLKVMRCKHSHDFVKFQRL